MSTDTLSTRLTQAYDYFNQHLWSGALPVCAVISGAHLLRSRVLGMASPNAIYDRRDNTSQDSADPKHPGRTQIIINMDTMDGSTDAEILSTLVHEMVHHWQYYFGSISRNGYHNRQWANEMERIGLMPSSLGKYDAHNPRIADHLTAEQIIHAAEGKRTGQNMSHYIIPGGKFEYHCTRLLTRGFTIHQTGRGIPPAAKAEKKKDPSKTKYTCPQCTANAWAKPGANLICGDCQQKMLPELAGTAPAGAEPTPAAS